MMNACIPLNAATTLLRRVDDGRTDTDDDEVAEGGPAAAAAPPVAVDDGGVGEGSVAAAVFIMERGRVSTSLAGKWSPEAGACAVPQVATKCTSQRASGAAAALVGMCWAGW